MTKSSKLLSQISQINPMNIPMVFWDTCSLLDILRIPERKKHDDLDKYIQLKDLIVNNNVISCTSECVIFEFNQHHYKQEQVLDSHQNKFEIFGGLHTRTRRDEDKIRLNKALAEIEVPPILKGILNEILSNTYEIKKQNSFRDAADLRIWSLRAPAKVKAEYKDCYIWETFIQMAQQFPTGNNRPKMIFFTNNTKDYFDNSVSPACVQPDIKNDLDGTKTYLATNINELLAKLNDHK